MSTPNLNGSQLQSSSHVPQKAATNSGDFNADVAHRRAWVIVGNLIFDGLLHVDFDDPEWHEVLRSSILVTAHALLESE